MFNGNKTKWEYQLLVNDLALCDYDYDEGYDEPK